MVVMSEGTEAGAPCECAASGLGTSVVRVLVVHSVTEAGTTATMGMELMMGAPAELVERVESAVESVLVLNSVMVLRGTTAAGVLVVGGRVEMVVWVERGEVEVV